MTQIISDIEPVLSIDIDCDIDFPILAFQPKPSLLARFDLGNDSAVVKGLGQLKDYYSKKTIINSKEIWTLLQI